MAGAMTLSHQRMLLFATYAAITFILSAVFATAGHESAFAPMCIFFPWVRLMVEFGLIPETKLAVIPFASVYIFCLFLCGSLAVKISKPNAFIVVLLLHLSGILLTMVLVHHDLFSIKRLASWSYTISIPVSFGYYFYDYQLIKEMDFRKSST
jgi:hypothetical protein